MVTIHHIKDIYTMSPKEIATELRLWAATYQDFKNNYDACLLLHIAKMIDKEQNDKK